MIIVDNCYDSFFRRIAAFLNHQGQKAVICFRRAFITLHNILVFFELLLCFAGFLLLMFVCYMSCIDDVAVT